jgi:hypothetical protein
LIATRVGVVDPVLVPTLDPCQHFKLLAKKRVKGMRYPELLGRYVVAGCS